MDPKLCNTAPPLASPVSDGRRDPSSAFADAFPPETSFRTTMFVNTKWPQAGRTFAPFAHPVLLKPLPLLTSAAPLLSPVTVADGESIVIIAASAASCASAAADATGGPCFDMPPGMPPLSMLLLLLLLLVRFRRLRLSASSSEIRRLKAAQVWVKPST